MSLAELKDRIKDFPISAIIEHYIPLQKKGGLIKGLCPFHQDRNPSLTVNDSKNMFMCFVCNTGGDAITFVQKLKRLDFVDALKDIAGVLGLPFEDYSPQKVDPKTAMARRILSRTIAIYQKSSQGQKVFQQFLANRKLAPLVAERFELGLAPANNVISQYLESIPDSKDKEFALSIARQINLIRPDQKDPHFHYDVFRERIIFPIWDQFGNPVGLGGRALHSHQKAKYYNSQESFHFNKKNILYGAHLAKEAIRQRNSVILVEGYMDLISMHQYGFANSVAVMGIALSEQSVNFLKSLTKNIYLALDSDQAGHNAMKRINKLWLSNGIVPKYLDFAPHKDPDEFLTHLGAKQLAERIENSIPFIDYLLGTLIPAPIPELSDKKLEILDQAFELIAPLGQDLLATERLIDFAQRLNIRSEPSHIVERYYSYLKGQKLAHPPASKEVSTPKVPIKTVKKLSKMEAMLISELVLHPECLTRSEVIELLDFVDNLDVQRYVKRLRELIFEIDDEEYVAIITSMMNLDEYPIEIREIAGAALYKYQKTKLNDKVIERLLFDIKRRLKEEKLKKKKKTLKEQQKSCSSQEELNSLLQGIIVIDKELKNLKKQKPGDA